jgi:hypothetical protein
MRRIATISLVLVFTGAIPISCNWMCLSSCGCGDFDVKDFTITAFGIRTTNSLHEDIDTTITYPFDAIYKTLFIAERQYVAVQTDNFGSLFINAASACSPPPMKAAEHFQGIKIISSSDITLANENDQIAAGQDITDRFVIAHEYTIDFQSIDSFVKHNADIYEDETFRIRLSKKPFKETSLNLKISILMTNGKTFEFDKEIMKVN